LTLARNSYLFEYKGFSPFRDFIQKSGQKILLVQYVRDN